jgi:hypothetical protein
MERTILLSLSDVLLVDHEAKTEIETKKMRFGRVRLFVLSLMLGLSLGAMLCVVEPQRSLELSLSARTFVRNALATLSHEAGAIVKAFP